MSCLNHVAPMCRDPAKRDALGRIFERLLASLESSGTFPPLGSEALWGPPDSASLANGAGEKGKEERLWTMFYLAQHYDKLGKTGDAPAPLLVILCFFLPHVNRDIIRALKAARFVMYKAMFFAGCPR